METPSTPSMGHYRPIKIPMSPTSADKSRTNRMIGLTKQTVRMPRASPLPPRAGMRLESIPVTPDPNSSTKRANKTNNNNKDRTGQRTSNPRLNKFVRRLHDMLVREKHSGIVEWRRGLLVLFSTDAFSKRILPKYFNTRNFKTFRRQLNYYGFVHVRSFSATGNTTTALWINQNLAEHEANDDVSAVLKLRRVEPDEVAKTVEGRRLRKELAIHTVEEDIGLNSKTLQMNQIRSMTVRGEAMPPSRGRKAYVTNAAATFLRPRSSSHSSSSSSHTMGHIPPVDSDHSMSSTRSGDDVSTSESSGFPAPPTMPHPRDEADNTDAAASVLLMLSRS